MPSSSIMKIQYEILAIEVDRLYARQFPPNTPDKVIADHCEYIAEFIRSTGWTEEEYLNEYIQRGLEGYFRNPNAN